MIENLTIERAVTFAIKTEQQGREFYTKLAKKHASDAEISELFTLLARDEELHETQFKALLGMLSDEELSQKDQAYLQAIATAEIFYGDNEALDPGFKVETREDALQRAFNLEKATLMYYSAIRDSIGSHAILDSIIAAEKDHMMRVMKYLMTGAKMRGLMDELD